MSSIKYERKDKLFVEGYHKFFTPNPEALTPEEIKNINNMSYPKRVTNRYIAHTYHNVSTTSYVIPVSDEKTITSYYIVRREAEDKSSLPLVVFFHGGGWLHSNMDFYLTYLRYFADRMECAVLLVDYRLGSQYKFPTALEDCYDAYLWAMEGVRYWKIDPDQVYILGDGFGGNLAATTNILLRDRKAPLPNGTILLYPLTDCRLRTQSMENFKDTPVLSERMLSFYIKSYSREPKDSLSPLMSPLLSQDLSRLSPTLIIAAGIDPLLDDGLLYGEKLAADGTKAKVLVAENSMHGFLPFRYAREREKAESAVWQMIHSRNVEAVTFLNKSEFKAFKNKR